jgi:hypothetical protein
MRPLYTKSFMVATPRGMSSHRFPSASRNWARDMNRSESSCTQRSGDFSSDVSFAGGRRGSSAPPPCLSAPENDDAVASSAALEFRLAREGKGPSAGAAPRHPIVRQLSPLRQPTDLPETLASPSRPTMSREQGVWPLSDDTVGLAAQGQAGRPLAAEMQLLTTTPSANITDSPAASAVAMAPQACSTGTRQKATASVAAPQLPGYGALEELRELQKLVKSLSKRVALASQIIDVDCAATAASLHSGRVASF